MCLTVKAVHLELVISQFILYSDHVTNFVGAACEIKDINFMLENSNEAGS